MAVDWGKISQLQAGPVAARVAEILGAVPTVAGWKQNILAGSTASHSFDVEIDQVWELAYIHIACEPDVFDVTVLLDSLRYNTFDALRINEGNAVITIPRQVLVKKSIYVKAVNSDTGNAYDFSITPIFTKYYKTALANLFAAYGIAGGTL